MNFKLLIIDDEVDLLECLKDSVELMFPESLVATASTVAEAVEKISESDCVLSDVNMPNRDGLEVLLRNLGKPVARITGHLEASSRLLLRKPYSEAELRHVICTLASEAGHTHD